LTYPKYETIFDASFINDVSRAAPAASNPVLAERTTYSSPEIAQVRGRAKWQILFRTGSADIDPRSEETLQKLYDDLIINRMNVDIAGHTDATGSPERNRTLSLDRARSVLEWLQSHSAADFPSSRVKVEGFGQDRPIASNSTESGRAQNRRVELTVGSAN
jgi:outer membrane protein OmpA-like peptidoglycan-associated protein